MKNHAFTLIELLVVVLIIGILAAVALPQYQKAVKKARLTEWIVYINAFYKGLDMYVLENGLPATGTVSFTGENAVPLSVDIACMRVDDRYCYTKFGRFTSMCGATHCWADLGTSYEGYSGFLTPGNSLETGKYYNTSNQIRLDRAPGPVEDRKILCELWSAYFGRDAMSETASASCAAVGR